jgi:hypothetical protein
MYYPKSTLSAHGASLEEIKRCIATDKFQIIMYQLECAYDRYYNYSTMYRWSELIIVVLTYRNLAITNGLTYNVFKYDSIMSEEMYKIIIDDIVAFDVEEIPFPYDCNYCYNYNTLLILEQQKKLKCIETEINKIHPNMQLFHNIINEYEWLFPGKQLFNLKPVDMRLFDLEDKQPRRHISKNYNTCSMWRNNVDDNINYPWWPKYDWILKFYTISKIYNH